MATESSTRGPYQRARSPAQKAERRSEILAAAEALITDHGTEALTIGALAKRAGFAKGTLYLYFETKEAVLQALFDAHFSSWCGRLQEQVEPGVSDRAFCEAFLRCTQTDSYLFGDARAGDGVESSPESLVEMMGMLRKTVRPLTEHLEGCLSLAPGAGWLVLNGLWALLLGAMQVGPKVSTDAPDVQSELARHGILSCEQLFMRDGRSIVAGIRADG